MRSFLFSVFILIFTLSAYSQRAFFDKKEITVGDRVNLNLEIKADAGKNIQFPVFDKVIIPGIEIVEQSDIQKDKKDNFLKQSITVTAFDDSLFLIKGFKFIVDEDTLLSNPVKLKVNYFKPDSAFISKIDTTQMFKIADIKSPLDAPVTFKEFMQRFGWYILVFLILGIIIFLIFKFLKNRKPDDKPLFVKEKPKIPAHIIALDSIKKLKQKELHKQEDLKPFYTELSNIIRRYIENRFAIPAPEMITSEIINEFEKTEFGNETLKNHLKELLNLSDTVKFAKNKPDAHENEIMFEYAESFVNKTKEREEKSENIENEIKTDKE